MGSLADDKSSAEERPQHELILPAYSISRTPITNACYAHFLKQARHTPPPGWLGSTPPRGKEQYPVVGVSWYDALAYCRWLAERTGQPYRLPTEAEWEKAARGSDGRLYPWGNEWQEDACNHHSSGLSAVDAFPAGISPFGCFDMLGNAREWTSTLWGEDYELSAFPYPYRLDDEREEPQASAAVYRIERGSAFNDRRGRHRCAARAWYAPDNKDKRRGFRVALTE
jgi:formylglycine-generating enzyme required for sulfatase activity